jgi:hypothetical protein
MPIGASFGVHEMKQTLQMRYAVYLQACKDLGIPAKSFDEWLAS